MFSDAIAQTAIGIICFKVHVLIYFIQVIIMTFFMLSFVIDALIYTSTLETFLKLNVLHA